jgi:hypothetical protein
VPNGNDSAWYAWLGFLAAMAGVDYLQFKKKRESEDPQIIEAQARAAVIRESGAVRAVPDDIGAAYLADGTVRTPAMGVVSVLPDYDREGAPPVSPRPVLTDHDRGVI